MKIEFAARSDVGKVRAKNEDSYRIWPGGEPGAVSIPAAVFAVADGMGGHPGGEIASDLAVQAAVDLAETTVDRPGQRLGDLFRTAAERIGQRGAREARYREMGTTLTIAALNRGLLWIGHIGDSRCYWIRGRRLVRLTRDHTVAQELVDAGSLKASDAETHPAGHVLTRCLGVCGDQSPDILTTPLRVEPGDLLLLATDGLCKVVACEELASVVQEWDPARLVDILIEAALRGGGPDNITLIGVRILDSPATAEGGGLAFDDVSRVEWARG